MAVETDTLRGAKEGNDKVPAQDTRRWRMVVALVVVLLVGVGVVVVRMAPPHDGRSWFAMTLEARESSQLRGRAPSSKSGSPSEPSEDDRQRGPDDLKALLLERFGLSEPAAATPQEPEQPADGHSEQEQQLKDKLLEEFGLNTQKADQKKAEPRESSATHRDPEKDAALREQLQHELRDQLVGELMPPAGGAATPRLRDWNRLEPAGATYTQIVAITHSDGVELPDVLRFLHEQRVALADASYRIDAQFARTVECFGRGAKQLHKSTLSQDDLEAVVGWMNDKCGEPTRDAHDTESSTTFSNAAMDKALDDHFDRLVHDFEAGNLDTQRALARAQALRAEIAACIARATENAADASGHVDESKLGSSLDWIVTRCAAIPTR